MATEKTDPQRTLALLWGVAERPNRGPKQGMSVDAIVRAAIKVADRDGFPTLSMRRVAEELGIGTMTLYTYVASKTELFDLMVDMVIGEGEDYGDVGWREWYERFARDSLAGYRAHPWLMNVSLTRGLMGPNQTASLEAMLSKIDGIGLNAGEMMAMVMVVVGYVRGVVQNASEVASLEDASGVSDDQWWDEAAPLHAKYLDPRRFPVLNSVFMSEDWETWVDPFEFGLQRLLDGIEAFVKARS
jgi:AcrR family transcriptional regulator